MGILAQRGVRRATAATIVFILGAVGAAIAQAGDTGGGAFPFGFGFFHPPFGPTAQPSENPPPPQRLNCKAPSVYSAQLGRCVMPAKQAVTCIYPLVKQGQACVCAAGYAWSGGKCVKPIVAKAAPPVVVDKPAEPVPDKPPASDLDVSHIQRCLAKLGYDPGATDGNIGAGTRTAFRTYQEENGLGSQPFNLTDQATQLKLFKMCDEAGPPPKHGSTTARP